MELVTKKKLVLFAVVCGLSLMLVPAMAGVNISSQGSLQYELPLKLPEGTAGLSPGLSIQFDSQTQNGMLGIGFFLKGLSAINRDSRYALNFDGNDHFTLDGEKLIYNAATGYYHTERETYMRIQAINLDTTASYWIVTHKDGTRYYYGYTSISHTAVNDGHIDAVGKGGKALLWALSRVEDAHGNYYTMYYLENSTTGAFYPQKIVYTDNDYAPISGDNTIEFIYELRSDQLISYNPTYSNMDQRLKSINIKVGVNLFRKYRLDYDYSPSTGQSRLTAIQEYGSDGVSVLPAVSFKWLSNSVGFTGIAGPAHSVNDNYDGALIDLARLKFGDFNGDGITDVYRIEGWGDTRGATINLMRTDGTYATIGGPFLNVSSDYDRAKADMKRIQLGDFNGDGITDVYQINGYGLTSAATIYFFSGNGSNISKTGPIHSIYGSAEGSSIDIDRIQFGDFNGDGITDVYVINGWGPAAAATIYLFKSDGTWTTSNGPYHTVTSNNEDARNDLIRIQLGDFNGDGITDVYQINGYGSTSPATIYLFNSSGTYRTVTGPSHSIYGSVEGACNDISRIRLGDFNGDGITDVYVINGWESSAAATIYFFKGDATFTNVSGPYHTVGSEAPQVDLKRIQFGDFNGDGITDVYQINGWGYAASATIYLMKADGTYVTAAGPFHHSINNNEGGASVDIARIRFGDFNGDGITDVYQVNPYGGFGASTVFRNNAVNNMVSQINNGLGGAITVEYKTVSSFTNSILPNPSNIYPAIAFAAPRYLVAKITNSDGLGGNFSTSYDYYNGKFYCSIPSERALLGFERIKQTDAATGNYAVTYYRQDKPYQLLVKEQDYYDKLGNLYQKDLSNYGSRHDASSPAGVNFIYTVKHEIYSYYDGPGTTGTFSNYSADNAFAVTNGINLLSPAILNLPKEPPEPPEPPEPTIRPTPRPTPTPTPTPTSTPTLPPTPQPTATPVLQLYTRTETVYTYDAYGNVATAINKGYDHLPYDQSESRFEYTYNTSTWILNKPQHTQVYGYDSNLSYGLQEETYYYYDSLALGTISKGDVTQETLKNTTGDVIIQHQYDIYGNQVWLKNGRGLITQTIYDPVFFKYVTRIQDAKNNYSYYYYDNFMRLVEQKDVNGVSTYHRYDLFSRLTKKWMTPDVENSPTEEIVYYDNSFPSYVNMKKREAAAGGVLDTYTYYDGFKRAIQTKAESETTANWSTMDIFYDSEGRDYKKSQPYFTAAAAYSTRNVSIPASQSFYDALGRKIKELGPDGTASQVYYNGDAQTCINAAGHVQKIYRDGAANIIKVEEFTGTDPYATLYATTTYIYNTGTGQLVKVTDTKGNQTLLAYDLLGRKTSLRDPDSGTWSYSYDANGNLISKRDPKNQIVNYSYDELDRNTIIDYPVTGDTTFYYDEPGYGKSIGKLTRAVYADGSESMSYDERGRNIIKTAVINGISRTQKFTYDSMNRVKTITYPDGEVVTSTYNTQGELETLTGLSTYISSLAYNPLNQVTAMTYGNGITTTYDYYDTATEIDSLQGLANSYRLKGIYAGNVFRAEYNYDKSGNILKRTDLLDPNNTQTYAYDELNRLTQATAPVFGAASLAFSYDAIGNLTQKDGLALSYLASRPHAAVSMGGKSISYDANGNMSLNGGASYTYNEDNMLASSSTGGSYNYFGEARIRKDEGGYITRYYFDTYEEVTNKTTGASEVIKYYYANGQRIAQLSSFTGLVYYHSDHLLNSSKMTNSSGIVVLSLVYRPYGQIAASTGNTAAVKYTFNDKELDQSGLYYFGSRYYDPALGRFTSLDVIVPSVFNPQALNRFSFAGNNPIVYMDNNGNCPVVIIGVCVGAAVGGATGGWRGMLVGALCGGIGAGVGQWVSNLIGPGFWGAVGGGAAGGGASAAVNTAFNGGNFFENIMLGALCGGIGGGVGYGWGKVLPVGNFVANNCFATTFVRQVTTSVISNEVSGLVRAAITGEDLADMAKAGAITGVIGGSVTTVVTAAMGNVCFVAGTPILTSQGSKRIEEIRAGDEVLSFNEQDQTSSYHLVKQTFMRETDEIVVVTAGSEKIETTREHPFYLAGTAQPWVKAGELLPGMKLQNDHGKIVTVENVSFRQEKRTVYNFEVDTAHSYYVGNNHILVHNQCGGDADCREKQKNKGLIARAIEKIVKDYAPFFKTLVEMKEWQDLIDEWYEDRTGKKYFPPPAPQRCFMAPTPYNEIFGVIPQEVPCSQSVALQPKTVVPPNVTIPNSWDKSFTPTWDMFRTDPSKPCPYFKPATHYISACKPGKCVICTELHRQGLMADDVYQADSQFGKNLENRYPLVIAGYHLWAVPVVQWMRHSQTVTRIVNALAQPWAEEMAYRMGVREQGNIIGTIYLYVGIPICFVLGLFVAFPQLGVVLEMLILLWLLILGHKYFFHSAWRWNKSMI